MIRRISPAQAGVSEEALARFLHGLKANGYNLHSLLLLRGNGLFFERYWHPFSAEKPHRMYSVTKSFVSVAIGCLIDEGKLSLTSRVTDFFPDKLPRELSPLMREQTVRDMLMMSTCLEGPNWFRPDVRDRTAFYFSQSPVKPAGTLFDYDSTGSYILGVLVERVSGMPLLAYLKKKVLDRIGGFENARILQTPDGTPWGDSALLCTSRALMNFARFVMNYGTWEGERLLSEDYLRAATACQTDNNAEGRVDYNRYGYGYQFWRTEHNGFACVGMGGQYAICVPDRDFICVTTADTQLSEPMMGSVFFRAVFDLVDTLDGAAPAPCDRSVLSEQPSLSVARGEAHSEFASKINGASFLCEKNPMGITRFRFDFDGNGGCLSYTNEQGTKRLPFGMKENRFVKFPQLGYSDERGNVHDITDFQYDCAASAGWIEPRKLQLRVQIIDRYLGKLLMTFGFRDETIAGVRMMKCAEDFLNEYEGWIIARRG